jgi:hypothetical protein
VSKRCPEGLDVEWAPPWAHHKGCPYHVPGLEELEQQKREIDRGFFVVVVMVVLLLFLFVGTRFWLALRGVR